MSWSCQRTHVKGAYEDYDRFSEGMAVDHKRDHCCFADSHDSWGSGLHPTDGSSLHRLVGLGCLHVALGQF